MRWDYKCLHCGKVVELFFPSLTRRDSWDGHLGCDECEEGRLIRLPAAPNFQVNGFNAQNGYSK